MQKSIVFVTSKEKYISEEVHRQDKLDRQDHNSSKTYNVQTLSRADEGGGGGNLMRFGG